MSDNRILGIFPRRSAKRGLPEPNVYVDALLYNGKTAFTATNKAMQLSAVYRAVQLISDAVAMLPITLFEDGKRVDTELSYLLNYEPNNISSRYMLLKMVVIDMLQAGNAFLLIVKDGGKVSELRYMKPEEVTIEYNEKQNRKRYKWKKAKGYLDDEQVLHFMNYTTDGIVGLSVLASAARALKIAYASDTTASNYFEKGGAITGILSSKAILSNTQKEEIRTQWKQVMANEEGGIAIVGADMAFQPITVSASDAQLLETRQFNVEEIARFYGVSPTLLGDLTKSSYATFEATSLDFLTNCLQPRLTNIEQELNRKLLLRREKQAKKMHFAFETEDLLRCTKTELASYYREMINNGVMSVNEVRRKLDFDAVEGGDEHYIQLNMSTLKNVAQNTQQDEQTN